MSLEQTMAYHAHEGEMDHPVVLTCLDKLGVLLDSMLDDGAVERSFFRRALVIWEHYRGPDHPETAQILNNLVP